MLVQEIMKTEVITLPQNATIANALQLLQDHRIRHIPIVNDNNEVIGIVSDRDVRDASPSVLLKNDSIEQNELENEIKMIMTTPVITIHPLDFVEEIARVFYDKEIACLPVVNKNKLVGIVTERICYIR